MWKRNKNTNKFIFLTVPVLILLLGVGWRVQAAREVELAKVPVRLARVPDVKSSFAPIASAVVPAAQWNPNCVMCHQSPKLNGVTKDSLQVGLTVDVSELDNSVHGEAGLECVSCHTLFTNYPHMGKEQVTCEQCHEQDLTLFVNLPYENRREMEIQLNESCRNCHASEFSANSIHTPVEQNGLVKTPLCTDCHGGHNVQHPADPPRRVEYTCGQCHTAVYETFLANKHNSANPQSQTCIDCHIPHEVTSAQAEPTASPEPTPVVVEPTGSFVNEWSFNCTMCHRYPSLTGVAEDASTVGLTVTDQAYSQSVHGQAGLGCAACHQDLTGYPHGEAIQVSCSECHSTADMTDEIVADLPYESVRALSVQMNEACQTCHEKEYDASAHGMHSKSLEDGNLNAPLCVDCHGSHEIKPATDPRSAISEQCATCHAAAYSSYQSSVHGTAVEKDNSPDAATCVDCHGVHEVKGPRDSSFRGESVAVCTRCHADQEMMSKYGLAADVFDPNVDNFHGQAVILLDVKSSDRAADTVVCYDCHGIHSMRAPDDPVSSVNQANIEKTCQQCHPDASSRFASTGLAHGKSSSGSLKILSWLNRIYAILMIAILILMVVYMILDGRRRRLEKRGLVPQALEE